MQTRRVPLKANNWLPPRKEDQPLLAAAWPAAVLGRALALASGSGGGAAALAVQCRGSVPSPVPRCRRPASCCRLPLPVLSHPDWSSSRVVFVLRRRKPLGRVASSRLLVCAVSVDFLFGVPGTQTTRWRFTGTDGIVALGQDREAEGPEHQVQLRTQGIPPIPGAAGGHGPAGTA